jgi:hypothetical protein
MVEVYFFLPAQEVDTVVECGLKLSKWAEREAVIEGESRKCVSALLNPRDDMKKYKSSEFRCVKLEVQPKFCYVADRSLYEVGLGSQEAMDMYMGSVLPVENYIFGSYRLPECLVVTTILPGQIHVLNKRLDSPILIGSSEELYINNIIETYKERHEDFYDCLLYNFFSKLAQIGKADKIEVSDKNITVFVDKTREKVFIVRKPDMGKY